jgi:hypothetical protein
LDSTTIVSGAHLMDTEGGQIEKTNLNISLITLCMLTAIDLARNQVNIYFSLFIITSFLFLRNVQSHLVHQN